jgi:hypothetical protein
MLHLKSDVLVFSVLLGHGVDLEIKLFALNSFSVGFCVNWMMSLSK